MITRTRFDQSGRCIPGTSVTAPVNAPSDRYGLTQPSIDYRDIYARITDHLGPTSVSADEFADRAEGLLQVLGRYDDTASVAAGVRVPFLLVAGASDDIGLALDLTFLPALARSRRTFTNVVTGRLSGAVGISRKSSHDRLLRAMAGGSVVGLYFPLALSGFSVPAARQQMGELPLVVSLSGAYEVCSALIGSPDLLTKPGGYPPQLELAALHGESLSYGYHFASYGSDLTFNGRHHHGHASDYVSPGLTVFVPTGKR